MRWRILNLLDLAPCPDALQPLRSVAEVVSLPSDPKTVAKRISEFDGCLASLYLRMDKDLLSRAKRLRAIATASTGTDHIDLKFVHERGIEVLSLKSDTEFLNRITATAELAWALLLAVVRRLPSAVAAAQRGDWARDEFRGHQLSGKVLGIVGYGRLGRMVGEFGKAFRMRVLACDVRPVKPARGVEMCSFPELLRRSDVVSVHVHLDEKTRGLFGRAEFARMKPAAILVNTSRGAVVDEAALLAALKSGRLAGAGLDVIEGEWRRDLSKHPLIRFARKHEQLVITPHIGGVTHESQAMAYARIVSKLIAFFRRQRRSAPKKKRR
jgi:D-3-phosphoglycerate dehydrogenase / 2-oxoglutarate reductase